MAIARNSLVPLLLLAAGCGGASAKSSSADGGAGAGGFDAVAADADASAAGEPDASAGGEPDADVSGAFVVSTLVEYGADDLVEGPLAGVEIRALAAPACATVVASGTTGADGHVTVEVTPGQSYCLAFTPPTPPAGATWLSQPSPVPAVLPQRIELVFETDARAPAGTLANGSASVLVTVKDNGPLAGATVTFSRAKSEHCPDLGTACPNCKNEYCIGSFATVASLTTKADGTAQSALPAGRYDAHVTPPAGWVSPWPRGFTTGSWSGWIHAGQAVQVNLELGPPGLPPATP